MALFTIGSLVHMTVEFTYKLSEAPPEMQRATLSMIVITSIFTFGILLATNLTHVPAYQIALMRAMNVNWSIMAFFNAGSFFYFGMKIEIILGENPEVNEKVIHSLRRFRHLFSFFFFNLGLVALLTVVFPSVMNWSYPMILVNFEFIATSINLRLFLKRQQNAKNSKASSSSSKKQTTETSNAIES